MMHKVVEERLEEYLRGAGAPEHMAPFHAHIAGCERCRREVASMEDHSRLFQTLRSSGEIEPAPGFYARVRERVESRRKASTLYAFLDPVFARRLIFASLAAVVVLGSFLFYSEPALSLGEPGPLGAIASQTPQRDVLGANPLRDRETMLLTLASYQE